MQRQKRQRPSGQKALPGGGLMRFGAAHIADDRALVVIPAAGFNPGQLSDFGLRPVRANQQAGG